MFLVVQLCSQLLQVKLTTEMAIKNGNISTPIISQNNMSILFCIDDHKLLVLALHKTFSSVMILLM